MKINSKIALFITVFACVPSIVQAMGLEPLEDTELSLVIGREGVALDFEYRMNADGKGNPLSSLNNCQGNVGNGANPCSLAITVNNREGMWVMLKDMYGVQKINSMWLDGGSFEGVGENLTLEYAGKSLPLSNKHPDHTRFQGGDGECLLPGKPANNCLADGLLGMVMQYEGSNTEFEDDVTWHLHIGRTTVQFQQQDQGAPYLQDNPGSFLSYQIRDFGQNEARIDYDGRVIMFGF